jgi:membrane protein YdbS with pleckstrin-like domain
VRKAPQYHAHLEKALQRLRATPVFVNLSDDEFRQVAQLLTPKKFKRAEYVISMSGQGELDLYVLLQGRASSRKAAGKRIDDVVTVYSPGDVINLNAFAAGTDSDETVEALSDLDVWEIGYKAFQLLLEQSPHLADKLGAPTGITAIWAKPQRYPFPVDAGEVVIVYRRKHWILLVKRIWPVPLLVLGGVILWSLPAILTPWVQTLPMLCLGIWALFTIAIGGWLFNDWHDDFYAVTNRRVVHREKVLFVSNRQAEAPVGQVRSVVVRRNDFIVNNILLLNVGDVVIDTLNSYHPITFTAVENPEEMSREILRQSQRAKTTEQALQRDVIREILRRQMGLHERPENSPKSPKLEMVGMGAPAAAPPSGPKPLPVILGSFFFPHMRVVDAKGNITYRHHWLLLFQTAWAPLLALLGYCALIFAGWYLDVLSFLGASPNWPTSARLLLFAALGIGLLALVTWLIFRYEDWRNDIFVLTKDKLIDIDRTPFGWQGMQQNVSPLDKVQNVKSSQDSFVDWLFDMGDVIVETGSDKPLVFERVKDPRQVQRDIAGYLAQLKADERANEVQQKNKELAEWISIYHEMLRLPYENNGFK